MIHRRFRRVVAPIALALAVAAGTSACSSSVNDAATITFKDKSGNHTIHITRDDFESELRTLVNNKTLMKSLNVAGDAKNTTDARLTAFWLTQVIRQKVVDEEFTAQKLSVTAQNRQDAQTDETNTQSALFNPDAFKAFPKSFQNKLIDREARLRAVSGECPSGKAVGHILVKTKAEADAIYSQLQHGANFAQLAQTKSTDTGSKALGGLLGCLVPSEFVPQFQTAAEAAQFDVPTQPVHSQFGYHVILVRRWSPTDSANPQLSRSLQQAAFATLNARLAAITVKVDPRYGTWTAGDAQQGAVFVAPTKPDVATGRGGTTTTVTVPATVPATVPGG